MTTKRKTKESKKSLKRENPRAVGKRTGSKKAGRSEKRPLPRRGSPAKAKPAPLNTRAGIKSEPVNQPPIDRKAEFENSNVTDNQTNLPKDNSSHGEQQANTQNKWLKFLQSAGETIVAGFTQDSIAKISTRTISVIDREIEKHVAIKTPSELTNSQLSSLERDYQLAFVQAQKSFTNAFISSFIGLGVLVASVLMFFRGISLETSFVTALAGALVELISALFLNMYSKAMERLDRAQQQKEAAYKVFYAHQVAGDQNKNIDPQSKITIINHLLGINDQRVEGLPVEPVEPLPTAIPVEKLPVEPTKPIYEEILNPSIEKQESAKPGLAAGFIQSLIVALIFILSVLLGQAHFIPLSFPPLIVMVLGTGLFMSIYFLTRERKQPLFLSWIILVNSVFLGYTSLRFSEEEGIGLLVFIAAVLLHYFVLLVLDQPEGPKRILIWALIILFLLVVALLILDFAGIIDIKFPESGPGISLSRPWLNQAAPPTLTATPPLIATFPPSPYPGTMTPTLNPLQVSYDISCLTQSSGTYDRTAVVRLFIEGGMPPYRVTRADKPMDETINNTPASVNYQFTFSQNQRFNVAVAVSSSDGQTKNLLLFISCP